MKNIIISLIEFIVCFIMIYFYYKLFIIKKDGRMEKKKLPAELKLFLYKNNVNVRKRSYKEIMKDLSILIAFDLSSAVFAVGIFNNIFLKILFALIVLYILYKLSMFIMVYVYKKKGFIENGKD